MNRLAQRLSALLLAFVLAAPNPAFALRNVSTREQDPRLLSGLEEALRSDHPNDLVQLASASVRLPVLSSVPTAAVPIAPSAAGLEDRKITRADLLWAGLVGAVLGVGSTIAVQEVARNMAPEPVVVQQQMVEAPAPVRVHEVSAPFWETGYGAELRLTGAQRAQVEQFVAGKQGKVEVTAVSGRMLFHLYADSALAVVADQKVIEDPVEGIRFDISSLREKPNTDEAFAAPGLIAADAMLPPLDWAPGSKSSVREVTISNTDFAKVNSVAWVALAYNPNLSLEQIVGQGVLTMTTTDAQGNTVHLVFA